MEGTKKFVLALDIGTTNVKCFIYDRDLQVVGRTVHQVNTNYYVFTYYIIIIVHFTKINIYLKIVSLSMIY